MNQEKERGEKGRREEGGEKTSGPALDFAIFRLYIRFLCACMCAASFASTVVTHDLEEEQRGKARIGKFVGAARHTCVCVCEGTSRGARIGCIGTRISANGRHTSPALVLLGSFLTGERDDGADGDCLAAGHYRTNFGRGRVRELSG